MGGVGTKESPYNTIQSAQERARNIRENSNEHIEVVIKEGIYEAGTGIILSANDSNTTYRAYGDDNVTVRGGVTVPISEFIDADDPRIPQSALGKVKMLNLTEKGIPAPNLCHYGHSIVSLTDPSTGNPMTSGNMPAIYVNGKMMTIARYPNKEDGYMTVASVTQNTWNEAELLPIKFRAKYEDTDIDTTKWENAENAWVYGYWRYDWSDMSAKVENITDGVITTDIPSPYRTIGGQKFYIYNLLEELDASEEWYYEKAENGDDILYFYAPDDCNDVTLAFNSKDIFNISNGSSINIAGLNIENGGLYGIRAQNAEYLTITGCSIKNVASTGIGIDGRDITVGNCEVSFTGTMGIIINGGNLTELISANNVVKESKIHDTSIISTRYVPSVSLNGVGNSMIDNEIYNAPHSGIQFGGNEHVISGNEIHDVVKEASDSGAIYSGGGHINYGNIIKDNYFHNIKTSSSQHEIHAVYFDYCMSGSKVINNRFDNLDATAVFINGGRDTEVRGNEISNSKRGVLLSTAGMVKSGAPFETDDDFIKRMGIDKLNSLPVYTGKYPETLIDTDVSELRKPKRNVIEDNTFTNCTEDIKIALHDNKNVQTTAEHIKSINTIQADARITVE